MAIILREEIIDSDSGEMPECEAEAEQQEDRRKLEPPC